ELRRGILRMGQGNFLAHSLFPEPFFLNFSDVPSVHIPFHLRIPDQVLQPFFRDPQSGLSLLNPGQKFFALRYEREKRALPFPFNFTASNILTRGNFDLVSRDREQGERKGLGRTVGELYLLLYHVQWLYLLCARA